MQLGLTRRFGRKRHRPLGPWALLGFGAGLAAGFVIGELFGTGGGRRVKRLVRTLVDGRKKPESRSALAQRGLDALSADVRLAGEAFELLAVGRTGFELHGWVADRATRGVAIRIAREALAAVSVVNCLLVRGEDDAPPPLTLDDKLNV
ncbi:MAG: hypothetical protein HOP28_14860, partial [Gemmatimonadales bacterium]|nr:hypothetical protein [Gemmatimonadales bacterium]